METEWTTDGIGAERTNGLRLSQTTSGQPANKWRAQHNDVTAICGPGSAGAGEQTALADSGGAVERMQPACSHRLVRERSTPDAAQVCAE